MLFRSLVLPACAACVVSFVHAPARAQLTLADPQAEVALPRDGTWSLAQALATALRRNRDIVVADFAVEGARGALQTASGAFDPRLNASADVTDDRLGRTRQSNTTIGVQQLLRDGTTVGGTYTGSGQRSLADGSLVGSDSVLGVRVTFPLLRGRGAEVATAAENIQRLQLQASLHTLRETASQQIFNTAQAYWRLRAADDTLGVLNEAQAQAEQQVRDTRRLIQGGEQPAANLNLVLATLNSRRAARLDAERNLGEARLALAELLGLDPAQLSSVARAGDPFPEGGGEPIPVALAAALADAALRQRFAIKAAEANAEAQRLSIVAARDNLRPVLNAALQLGARGTTPQESPLEPLVRLRGQRQVSATLQWQWDIGNNEARGRYLSAVSGHDQQAAALQGLRRSVGAAVGVAVASYNATLAQLAQSRQTVELFRRVVAGERAKQRLNNATLLDVVNVENSLQQALVQHIATLASHAVAIAALRFQAGEMIREDPQSQLLPLNLLLGWPGPGEPSRPWTPR